MKRIRFFSFWLVLGVFLFVPIAGAEDINDIAYESRVHLGAGTIWNFEGKGDCLIFPYYDARNTGNIRQVTNIDIENVGEYGIAAKLRFREWARGKEVFSKDIWIPSKGVWSARVEINEDGTNAIIVSSGNVISRYDSGAFYFANSLSGGIPFSIKNIRKVRGESTLYGFVEVIGEEKTSPDNSGGKATRLSKSERDCPNTLRGVLSITRVEDGATMAYEAVAIGNFSRGQGSLFRSPGSPYPRLDNCEDTLDQLEFQLSKWEVFGPFSVTSSNQGKTSLIMVFPTKHFHYPNGRRLNQINNPFEAQGESQGQMLKSSFSNQGLPLFPDSEIALPFSVNVIGLYQGSGSPPTGVDNLSLPIYSSESGEIKLTSNDMAQRTLIQDYEYFREMFTAYRGLPVLGLVLREYRNPNVLHATITPAEFSAVWEASDLESILFPTFVSGPSFVQANMDYIYTTGGASSTVGHPIQYEINWGDGTTTGWLDVGVTSATKNWSAGGMYAVRSRARCALHPDIISKWSKGLIVTIESVSPPSILNGPVVALPSISLQHTFSYVYTTGGAASNLGHPIQYMFDWGDSTDSNWLPVGTTTATKIWPKGGEFAVRARARCITDPSVISDWTPDLVVKVELITPPSTPIGQVKGLPGDTFTYMTGGASSNINDPIEYQFDWGDGTVSPWQSSTSASKTWSQGGTFEVRARARCAVHTFIESAWSSVLTVNIEKISKPNTPSGPTNGIPNTPYKYTTGGATSNIGDPVQYQFRWGIKDSLSYTYSEWLPVGVTDIQIPFSSPGIYVVEAKARCALHNAIQSDWSDPLEVEIETVSIPDTPVLAGDPIPSPPFHPNVVFTFETQGAASSLDHPVEYQFDWGDGTQSLWISPDEGGIASVTHKWRTTNTFPIKARARCKTHPVAISDWSPPLSFTIE